MNGVENLADLAASELVRRTASGASSVTEAVQASLERIARRDPGLNAFSVVLADRALEDAIALEARTAAGAPPGPLHGVPVAIKEEIDVEGCVTTFGGLGNSTPAARDGEVVRRLRQAGAIIVGKTRMPEFGQWPYTESDAGGVTRNPWDRTRTPGGSSGGSAAAVAAGMVPVAIGGDGGGSIRIPSACCGLFGLKPTRGRVTSDPMPHLWWSLGTTGPLTRTVLDSALVYDVIRGNTAGDRYTAPEPPTSFIAAAGAETPRLRIGWSVTPVSKGVRPAPAHVGAVEETARLLADLGHDVREIDPRYPDPTAAFVPQFFAGVRTESDAVEHFERLERRTRQTYRLGAWVGESVLDKAIAAGERVSERANRVFADVDVLLTPTIAHRPRRTGALASGGTVAQSVKAMPMIAYTALWNVTGNPAASVPAGVAADGLPLAVQLVGPIGEETTLISLAAQLERARGWPLLTDPRLTLAPSQASEVNLFLTPKAWVRRHLLSPVLGLPSPLRGKRVLVTGASSGIGAATASAVAARGAHVLLVARRAAELNRIREQIEVAGGTASCYVCDLTDAEATDDLVRAVLADHGAVDMLVNNAGRSIRRSLEYSYDRMHDFERTMAINYFGPVRLILGLLPAMREQRFGHVVNVVTWGVQIKAPRFSAYIASKTALDTFSRIAGREAYADNVTFTNLRLSLVRTEMITSVDHYTRSPAKTPEQAAALVVRALEDRPLTINTAVGSVSEVLNLVAPRLMDAIAATASKRFPDSSAARGETPPQSSAE